MAAQQTRGGQDSYLFMSAPKAVGRPKYRDPDEVEEGLAATANIMWDARVVRGKNSSHTLRMRQQQLGATQSMKKTAAQVRRENQQRKERLVKIGAIRPEFPSVKDMHEAVRPTKTRVEVPLHLYLFEQAEPVVTSTEDTQTDQFLPEVEETEERVYIPRKTGVDSGTQVHHDIVFNYDEDVKPLMAVVVGKTLQQSLQEVREEEEAEFYRKRMVVMELNGAIIDTRQLEREKDERRRLTAIQTKVAALQQLKKTEGDTQKKLASNRFARKYLRKLQEGVLADLTSRNFFQEPIQATVENSFMPELYLAISKHLSEYDAARQQVEELLKHGVVTLEGRFGESQAARDAAAAVAEAERQAKLAYEADRRSRKMKIHLFIHSDFSLIRRELEHSESAANLRSKAKKASSKPIGPINLTGESTVADVERRVLEFLSVAVDKLNQESDVGDAAVLPTPDRLSFSWHGEVIDKSSVLYQLGVANLSTLQMLVEPLPEPTPAPSETEETEAETTEEKGEDAGSATETDETAETDETTAESMTDETSLTEPETEADTETDTMTDDT
jgi:hypothetical protein